MFHFPEITTPDGHKILSHSPKDIIEQFLSHPSSFINFLEENYLPHFSCINDVDKALMALSEGDCLLAEWRVRISYLMINHLFEIYLDSCLREAIPSLFSCLGVCACRPSDCAMVSKNGF